MPLIHVTAPQGALNKSQQNTLMSQISNAVLIAEGADINDPSAQSLVWAYYNERPVDECYVGGEHCDKPPLIIAVTTPKGALNSNARPSLVENIGEIVDAHIDTFEGRLNHWAMLHELNEGSWAGAGQIFTLAAIQSAMNIKAA